MSAGTVAVSMAGTWTSPSAPASRYWTVMVSTAPRASGSLGSSCSAKTATASHGIPAAPDPLGRAQGRNGTVRVMWGSTEV